MLIGGRAIRGRRVQEDVHQASADGASGKTAVCLI